MDAERHQKFASAGVKILEPYSTYIDEKIQPNRIGAGTIIFPCCRIIGEDTYIGKDSKIGFEAPVTIENCALGNKVNFAGGYASDSVFLDGASIGSCAHIRAGTLLEEDCSVAHAVGLKQTVLLSYSVMGSLINFCDALFSGGTSSKHHSEVGSSYIHFNFTPHQDKATASLFGDVPHGVLRDQPPIFLGGQGGAVGPLRVAFGTIVAAGYVLREDVLQPCQLVIPQEVKSGLKPYKQGAYRSIARIVTNNLIYIGNISALKCWYKNVRSIFMQADMFSKACLDRALSVFDIILEERIKRLNELAEKMPNSVELNRSLEPELAEKFRKEQEAFMKRWAKIRTIIRKLLYDNENSRVPALLATAIGQAKNQTYSAFIKTLNAETKAETTKWLQKMVEHISGLWQPPVQKEKVIEK